MATAETLNVIEPTPTDVEAARESLRSLTDTVVEAATLSAVNGLVRFNGFAVPTAVVPLLMRVLAEVAEGHRVAIQPMPEEPLSTTEAAGILNVSRPTLINLLESGEIRYHLVGTHRRVSRASLLEYKRRMDAGEPAPSRQSKQDRLRGLRQMVDLGIEAGEPH
ncbi:MAG TPA: helix-turn-helix domain-containing protein [Longimicrobium sp.]|jgi:excisionase family DNA binding protein|uniref:helix-turn-helix domain-containing protein n=1 Tax=Longimicrobium sp. TaxID=2029185 RepID=UPI002ED7E47D